MNHTKIKNIFYVTDKISGNEREETKQKFNFHFKFELNSLDEPLYMEAIPQTKGLSHQPVRGKRCITYIWSLDCDRLVGMRGACIPW